MRTSGGYLWRAFCGLLAIAAFGAAAGRAGEGSERYEIGGPLAGIELPLFPGQHGAAPGYPGVIPALKAEDGSARNWGREGLAPELQLYPGSVEHWRAYWFKYCPVRSFFDAQSQVRNWTAPDIPGAPRATIESYAEPIYWIPRHASVRNTGLTREPVEVVRWRPGRDRFSLDLGTLPVSMYALRVIAAVETKRLRTFRRPVFLCMKVNDGNRGETQLYKRRISYCDEFYSVCELYFHAPARRAYRAELWMDERSEVDLLVHNVSLDDVLAGTTKRALKKASNRSAAASRDARPSRYSTSERLARDAAIWNALPPLNHQGSGNTFRQASFNAIFHPDVQFGADGMTRDEFMAKHGAWKGPGLFDRRKGFTDDHARWDVFIRNEKRGLTYTLDDMRAYKPLPDPYPYKDDGLGIYFPDASSENKGKVFAEIALEVMNRIRAYPTYAKGGMDRWRKSGDTDAARDGAVALARYAYLYPSIESATYLCNASRDPGAYGRNMYNRRRETAAMFMTHYGNYLDAPSCYDGLYDYIQDNRELAASIGRFVPWVKTPDDVVQLFDVYLVQATAKRVLRYQYHTGPMKVADLAVILGSSETTAPWLEWVFSRTFVYPLPPAGVQNLMISGSDRSGPQYIGSTYYAQGQGALGVAHSVQKFVDVLPPKYDLTNCAIYPKPLAKCYWHFEIIMGGKDFCRIGDVAGPDKTPGYTLGKATRGAASGWKWSKDPRFAWMLVNKGGKDARKEFSPAEWSEIERAARGVKRAPWLDNRSRQVYNWFGALETGHEHDDFASRRGVYVRTGAGYGHHHDDTLDLQFFAHGLPMTVDGGQRPGYCTPADRSSIVHNLVVVDGRDHRAQSWVRSIADCPGARHLSADAAPPGGCSLYRRDVALIDVAGRKDSYVFDVFRVAGGSAHAYCFHGPITDEVTSNATNIEKITPPADGAAATADQARLRPFKRSSDRWLAGVAPDVLQTTWRYTRDTKKGRGRGCEQRMSHGKVTEATPRKYTRLHLFDCAGERVLRADAVCHKWDYEYHQQLVERRGTDLSSAFMAIYEPYVGSPFVTGATSLSIPGNEDDALRAVAVAVDVSADGGQSDVCFSDGRPDRERRVDGLRIAGEFAYYSTDRRGLRHATISGGTLLRGPALMLRPARRERSATVTKMDYHARKATIDAAWPATDSDAVVEVIAPERTTSCTFTAVEPAGARSVVTIKGGADYYRSLVTGVDEKAGVVTCQLKPSLGALPGLSRDFVASNEAMTKFWRADVLGGTSFRLRGAPVSMADFGEAKSLRLWEYGVGDRVRQSTFASLRRAGPGEYALEANVDVEIGLPGTTIETSTDGATWRRVRSRRDGAFAIASVPLDTRAGKGHLFVRAW